MIATNHEQPTITKEFYNYLINDIGLSKEAIELGIRHSKSENAPLSIILWSFGLISSAQYQNIIIWSYNK